MRIKPLTPAIGAIGHSQRRLMAPGDRPCRRSRMPTKVAQAAE